MGHITSTNKRKSWSNILRISTKHQFQNLNLTSASQLNLKFKILTKASFRISTKIQLHKLHKTSAAKYWPNSSLKLMPELHLRNLDQALCSKSEQKFSFMTKPQFLNLQQTVVNMTLIININWILHMYIKRIFHLVSVKQVSDFRFGHQKCPFLEWEKATFTAFPYFRKVNPGAWNENLHKTCSEIRSVTLL